MNTPRRSSKYYLVEKVGVGSYNFLTSNSSFPETQRAGLVMSVARIERYLRKGEYAKHIRTSGAVYMAAVLEYLSAEILDLSASECTDRRKRIIQPRDVKLAIGTDSELNELLKDVIIPGAGVLPNIEPFLLPKERKIA